MNHPDVHLSVDTTKAARDVARSRYATLAAEYPAGVALIDQGSRSTEQYDIAVIREALAAGWIDKAEPDAETILAEYVGTETDYAGALGDAAHDAETYLSEQIAPDGYLVASDGYAGALMLSPVVDFEAVSDAIQAMDLDVPFTLYPTGEVGVRPAIYTPEVYHDDEYDITIDGRPYADHDGWEPLTGLTGQYGYSGAVLHPSENMSPGVARAMLEHTEEGPVVYVLAVVGVLPDESDPDVGADPEPAGWAILRRTA